MQGGCRKLYALSVGFSFRRGSFTVSQDLGGSNADCEALLRERSSLSQSASGRTSIEPAGPQTATRSSYAIVRFVNRTRSWATDGAARRHTTNIPIGSEYAGAAVGTAARPSRFFRCFLFLIPTSVCWHASRRCGDALKNAVHGRRHYPS